MAKYAPHTFPLVIDNSGFCVCQLDEILGSKLGGATGTVPRYIDGKRYTILANAKTLWSLDETSDFYFSDAHKYIRNLLVEEHRVKSDTVYCCYHSIQDNIAPIGLKDKMYESLRKYNQTYYKRVEDKDIDGQLFKTTEHGMRASLRSMFDCSMEKYREFVLKGNWDTDFELGATNKFACLDRQYKFSFSDKGLEITIDKPKTDSSQFIRKLREVDPQGKNNVIYINNTKRNAEVARNIIDLIPTMKVGLEFMLQNSDTGKLAAGMQVAEDFAYCINSIDVGIKSISKTLPLNQLEYKIKSMMKVIGILMKEYKADHRENIAKNIDFEMLPLFEELEKELISVL